MNHTVPPGNDKRSNANAASSVSSISPAPLASPTRDRYQQRYHKKDVLQVVHSKQTLLLLLSEAQKFVAKLIQFQSLTPTSNVDIQAFPAKKVDWSL